MITAGQKQAARALLGIDQRKLAEPAGCRCRQSSAWKQATASSAATSNSLMKLVAALDAAGVELIADNAASAGGGRGVRLKAAVS